MSEYTQEQILQMVNARTILEDLATSYFWERYKADPEWRTTDGECEWVYTPGIDSIEINEGQVEVSCSAAACRRGCCGTDYRTYRFPTSYLWLDQSEILADMKARADAKARAETERKQKAEEERKRKAEEAEREKLAELKAKYEGGAT